MKKKIIRNPLEIARLRGRMATYCADLEIKALRKGDTEAYRYYQEQENFFSGEEARYMMLANQVQEITCIR